MRARPTRVGGDTLAPSRVPFQPLATAPGEGAGTLRTLRPMHTDTGGIYALKALLPPRDEENVRCASTCRRPRHRRTLAALTGAMIVLLRRTAWASSATSPIFRDGFSRASFHDFYRGMSSASDWFAVESSEMMLGLGSALIALLVLLLLSMERSKSSRTLTRAATKTIPPAPGQVRDPVEARRLRRAEARRRRNARAAAETSSRLGM